MNSGIISSSNSFKTLKIKLLFKRVCYGLINKLYRNVPVEIPVEIHRKGRGRMSATVDLSYEVSLLVYCGQGDKKCGQL